MALKTTHVSRQMRATLAQEARTLTALIHPHIVRIYNADIIEGRFVLAMEHMAGGSLAGKLWDEEGRPLGPLPAAAAVRIARQVLDGLAFAHGRNVVHRDIKPANVLFDESGNARLGDFGIAKILDSKGVARTIAGTPPYMAPEQWGGNTTVRSDVYAVGAVLYEMVTGRRAVDGASESEIMERCLRGNVAPPRQVDAGVPAALEAVILKAMALEPADRFPSAEAFAAALEPPPPTLIVPDLTGKTVPEARRKARGFIVKSPGEAQQPDGTLAMVVEQRPAPGKKARAGTTIEVTLSTRGREGLSPVGVAEEAPKAPPREEPPSARPARPAVLEGPKPRRRRTSKSKLILALSYLTAMALLTVLVWGFATNWGRGRPAREYGMPVGESEPAGGEEAKDFGNNILGEGDRIEKRPDKEVALEEGEGPPEEVKGCGEAGGPGFTEYKGYDPYKPVPRSVRGEGAAGPLRTSAEIYSVIQTYLPGTSHIYKKYLKTNPGMEGKIEVRFTIAASGTVTNASVVSSTISNPAFESEVVSNVMTWRFPAVDSGEITVVFPFVFIQTW